MHALRLKTFINHNYTKNNFENVKTSRKRLLSNKKIS